MNTYQKLTIVGALALLAILLFGFSTKPKKLLQEEKVRALNSTSTDISIIKKEVLAQITGDQRASIQIIEAQVESEEDSILQG